MCDHAYVIANDETGWLHCMFCHFPVHKMKLKKQPWADEEMDEIWNKDPEYFKQQ